MKILLTNADHESIRNLYSGIGEYQAVERKSVIAGSSQHRRPTTEAMYFIS